MKFNLRRIRIVLALVVSLAFSSIASAQLDGRLATSPIGVGYMRDVTQVRMFEYMQQLSQALDVGKFMVQQVTDEQLESLNSGVDHPVSGTAWYMVQGLIPSFNQISFQEVKDLAGAKRMINVQKEAYGDSGVLEDLENDSFRLSMVTVNTLEVPEGMTAEKFAKQFGTTSGPGYTHAAEVVEEDGKKKVKQSYSYTQFFRYHDSLMFSSSFEELATMDLPSRDSLTSRVSSDNDMGAEANFDRIPEAIKTLGWSMLSASAGPQLQRRDEEAAVDATLRKTSLSTGLDIVKSVMFDVDKLDGWLRFANADLDSLKGQLNFKTRRNSGLVKQLDEIASATSRMAPVLRDDAAATFHTCFRVSKDAAETLPALSDWFQHTLANSGVSEDSTLDAAAKIGRTLIELSERRDIELLVKAGYTEESGGVIYGGLQVGENTQLLESVYRLARETAPASASDAFGLTTIGERQVLSVKLPPEFTQATKAQTSLQLTDVFMVRQGPNLWFAVGGTNASAMIDQCIARCEASGLASRTPIATLHVDAAKWLEYPQDDEVGVGGLLKWLDANESSFPWSPLNMSFGGNRYMIKPTPLLDRVFALGGGQDFKWTIIADKSGLQMDLVMGEAIANYHVARLLDTQDRMMNSQQDYSVQEAEASPE